MDILTNMYEKPSTSNQIFLLKKLVNMKLSDRSSVVEHINNFTHVTNQLESAGINLEMKLQALLFLCSLPDSYNTAVQGISSTMKGDLTLDDAMSSIMDEEMRRKVSGGEGSSISTSSTALAVENRGRSKNRGRFGGRGKSQSRGRNEPGKDECWFCHKTGHRRHQCEAYKRKQQEEGQRANVVSNEPLLENMCLTTGAVLATDEWFVDSGASFHCTSQRDVFHDYASGDFGEVIVGNGHKCPIVGKGTVTVKVPEKGHLVLYETRHIPQLNKNLISTSKLDQEGYVTTFGSGQWKITSGARVIAKGKRAGTLYILRGDSFGDTTARIMVVSSPSTLWHYRLGHLGEEGVKELHSRKLLPGLKKIEMDFCESCIYGKQKAVSFQLKGKKNKSKKLELVHSMYGDRLKKSLMVVRDTLLLSLMMQRERLGSMLSGKNQKFSGCSKRGSLWSRTRRVIRLKLSNLIMEVNIQAKSSMNS